MTVIASARGHHIRSCPDSGSINVSKFSAWASRSACGYIPDRTAFDREQRVDNARISAGAGDRRAVSIGPPQLFSATFASLAALKQCRTGLRYFRNGGRCRGATLAAAVTMFAAAVANICLLHSTGLATRACLCDAEDGFMPPATDAVASAVRKTPAVCI